MDRIGAEFSVPCASVAATNVMEPTAASAPSVDRRRRPLKRVLNIVALVIIAPCGLSCWLEHRLATSSQAVFVFWTNVVAVLPGTPGIFLRRAFYRWTLDKCAEEVIVEFGALFTTRNARVESGAYVGAYALIGYVYLGENALVGSRASLLSGGQHHQLLPSGEWSATDHANLTAIEIGRNTWIGEGAILMAGTGSGCMVAAGTVVSTPVPAGVMVAGNPARFVRRLAATQPEERVNAAASIPPVH
jgi:virginiamycin A acetyltransferase